MKRFYRFRGPLQIKVDDLRRPSGLRRTPFRPFCFESVFLGIGIGQIIPQTLSPKNEDEPMFSPGINRYPNPFDLFDLISKKLTNLFALFGRNSPGSSIDNDPLIINGCKIAPYG